MQVKGNHEFNISREQLWSYLMDPEVLAKITPGVTRLETIDTDQYKSVSDIKIGPVKGSFTGKLKVQNKNEPASFEIKMEQLSKIGNAHATVFMNLEEKENGNAALVFNGKANLSGVIARTGQRVLSGVANTLTKEVFSALEKHIEEDKQSNTTTITATEEVEVNSEPTTTSSNSLETSTETSNQQVPLSSSTNNQVEETGMLAVLKKIWKSIFGN